VSFVDTMPRSNEPIVIRQAWARDRQAIEAMSLEAVNWNPERVALSAAEFAAEPALHRYVAGWPRSGDVGVVAEADGAVVGAAWLRFFDALDPGYGYIDRAIPELSVGVAPDWRGQGVGGRLIAALVDLARDRGIAAVSLSVELGNPARTLYERHGFRSVERNGDAITMRRDIREA
jgi:GNAT superfamily N-acetyltransferase